MRNFELRTAGDDPTAYINAWCVVCYEWLDTLIDEVMPFDFRDLYVDGEHSGFAVCHDCAARPSEELAADLQAWTDDVLSELTH